MKSNDCLDDFVDQYDLISTNKISKLSNSDLVQLKESGYSIEELLNHLSDNYFCLLHGSRTDISDDYLIPNSNGDIFASNTSSIALMRSIISNNNLIRPGLKYSYYLDEKNPLKVEIYGINDETIGDNGFIYVLPDIIEFSNQPPGSWQYIAKCEKINISAVIPVNKTDFLYSIYDITNNKKIQ